MELNIDALQELPASEPNLAATWCCYLWTFMTCFDNTIGEPGEEELQ